MSKVFTGSKGSLKLNGVKVAFVSSINVNWENNLARIDIIDQLESAELAEVGHTCSFSCNLLKVDENAAKVLGLEFDNINDLLTQPELSMEIYDRVSDKVQINITGVKLEGGSGSIDARGVYQGSWNFQGRMFHGA